MQRALWTMFVLITACGGGKHGPKDATPVPQDPPADPAIDAPLFPACATPVPGSTISLRKISTSNVPGIATLATSAPGDPRLFVVGADGRIWIFKNEVLTPTPFLDLRPAVGGPVTSGGEMGLLGLAFHPQYASNGLFFIYYTTGDITTNTLRDVVTRCSVSTGSPDIADPASCVEVLSIADPAVNHNGGMMEFGREGLLYIATGDGGGNFNLPRSQDPTLLLGKMLRIDIDHGAPGKEYGIPVDNPYVAGGGAPEVLMIGLRNPWRWSFDSLNGDLWIGDVGAATIEELDVLHPSEQKAANLGWSMYEGSNCFHPPCDPSGKVFPKDERNHSTRWAAIIGGQVYRGNCYPDLVGWYFYADDVAGAVAKARLRPDDTLEVVDLQGTFPTRPTSIHEDYRGELYMTDVSGFVYHLEAGP